MRRLSMPEQMESTIDVPALVSQLEVISQEILVNERLNIEDRKNAAMIVHTLILICRNRADLIRKSSVFYMTVRCTTDYFDLTESVAIHMENYCLHRTRGNPPTDKQKEEMLLRSLPLCFVQAYNTIKVSDDERSMETFIVSVTI